MTSERNVLAVRMARCENQVFIHADDVVSIINNLAEQFTEDSPFIGHLLAKQGGETPAQLVLLATFNRFLEDAASGVTLAVIEYAERA